MSFELMEGTIFSQAGDTFVEWAGFRRSTSCGLPMRFGERDRDHVSMGKQVAHPTDLR